MAPPKRFAIVSSTAAAEARHCAVGKYQRSGITASVRRPCRRSRVSALVPNAKELRSARESVAIPLSCLGQRQRPNGSRLVIATAAHYDEQLVYVESRNVRLR